MSPFFDTLAFYGRSHQLRRSYVSVCTPGGLMLAGAGSSPTSSLRSAAALVSAAATLGSEVVFAILSSAAAASRA
jgi:hypothetical protein